MEPKIDTDPDQILTAEFTYITQAAFQANEDRARVTSYYLVSVGSFIAAILGTQLLDKPDVGVYWAFFGLFLFLAVLAVLTILQLVRLRLAWHDAARAMNQIKDYYVRSHPGANLAEAFAWHGGNLPPRSKPGSISFYLAVEVALIGAASFGAAVFFFLMALGWSSWLLGVLAGLLYFCGEIYLYRRKLK